ncbi:hypothetical protein [Romboutsia lituseburensis]|uniref:ABC-2 family transporter protein n=1 Tax=Romboutsia lituseburensis DSM 797 TaxID=1121325 RepID=A0A1G9IW15_9FIRM|nr:hypothetical protein [Romboutsia lituseburensis]CEH33736.1 ABC-2 family transporter protein [Romboutsia lituseburensis]SDL29312.1 hypothetical protein SAMN04515677_101405 [Romboutsia lituseburensis DSM 797]
MLTWEIKKIIKEKTSIIALVLLAVMFLQISFIKPMLETQNEYFDESKKEYFIDKRDKEVIANEKLQNKVEQINEIIKSIPSDGQTKALSKMSNEKIKLDDGSKYENVDFYKVFSYRVDFGLSIMIMIIILVMICSNLYVDEQISNVSTIMLSSKNKNKALNSKLLIAVFLPVILYGVYILGTGIITYIQYGKPLNGSLQAYRISDIALLIKPLTINQYVINQMVTSVFMLMGISLASLLSSFISDNSVKSIGLSVGFIALGKILTMFKFLPTKILQLLGISNYVDVIMGMGKISGFYNGSINIMSKSLDLSNVCLAVYALIVVIGVLANIYCIKKVLTK